MRDFYAVFVIFVIFSIKKYILLDDFTLAFQERNKWLEGFILQSTFVEIIRWSIRCSLRIILKTKGNISIQNVNRTIFPNNTFQLH